MECIIPERKTKKTFWISSERKFKSPKVSVVFFLPLSEKRREKLQKDASTLLLYNSYAVCCNVFKQIEWQNKNSLNSKLIYIIFLNMVTAIQIVHIVAYHLSEGSHFSGVRTCGGLGCKWSSHNASEASNLSDLVTQDLHVYIGYIARHPFINNTTWSRYTIKSLLGWAATIHIRFIQCITRIAWFVIWSRLNINSKLWYYMWKITWIQSISVFMLQTIGFDVLNKYGSSQATFLSGFIRYTYWIYLIITHLKMVQLLTQLLASRDHFFYI